MMMISTLVLIINISNDGAFVSHYNDIYELI
jgi:hypothetical protein